MFALLSAFARPPGALRDLARAVPRIELFALVVPGRLGDLGLVYFLGRHYPRMEVLAALFVDKVISVAVVGALAALGVGAAMGWPSGAALFAFEALGLGGFAWIASSRGGGSARPRYAKLLPRSLAAPLAGFQGSLKALLSSRRAVLLNLTVTLAKSFLYGMASVVGYRLFGFSVPVVYTVLAVAVAQLVSSIPISASGLGIFEAMNILLMQRAGVTPEVVLALGLSGRVLCAIDLALVNLALAFAVKPRS
jgi:uncharacterized membrane protein YbhN (UPF0104 family)